jgi:hypothetical protein
MSYDASEEQELLEQVDDDAHEQQAGAEKRDSTAGAIVRAITRQGKVLSRLMARADIGALPRRLPTQRVASLSDTFAKGVDVWTSYTEGRQKAESAAAADSKLRRALRAGVHAVPSFARSAVLGTALFAAYETTFDAIATAAPTNTLPLEQAQSSVLHNAAASDQVRTVNLQFVSGSVACKQELIIAQHCESWRNRCSKLIAFGADFCLSEHLNVGSTVHAIMRAVQHELTSASSVMVHTLIF